MLSKKLIYPTIFVFGIGLGAILACILFVYSVNNDQKWGDYAAWLGAIAACLALSIAVLAAFMAKESSDIQNENNTVLALNDLVEKRSQKINDINQLFQNSINEYISAQNAQINGSVGCDYTKKVWYKMERDMISNMKYIYVIMNETIKTINNSKIHKSSKRNAILLFFSLMDLDFCDEVSEEYLSKTFYFSFAHESKKENYREIFSKVKKLFMQWNSHNE